MLRLRVTGLRYQGLSEGMVASDEVLVAAI